MDCVFTGTHVSQSVINQEVNLNINGVGKSIPFPSVGRTFVCNLLNLIFTKQAQFR